MAIAIVSGFALCWLAFSTILLLLFFARDSRLVYYLPVSWLFEIVPSILASVSFLAKIIVKVSGDSRSVFAQCKSEFVIKMLTIGAHGILVYCFEIFIVTKQNVQRKLVSFTCTVSITRK